MDKSIARIIKCFIFHWVIYLSDMRSMGACAMLDVKPTKHRIHARIICLSLCSWTPGHFKRSLQHL